ncbi:MAG: hypothetical protein FRX49_11863 [Trebouxia sp. A1-2]|nr:MAG: hypothetical protein FRX49_11863 [Trebouxia sp. A1-2]
MMDNSMAAQVMRGNMSQVPYQEDSIQHSCNPIIYQRFSINDSCQLLTGMHLKYDVASTVGQACFGERPCCMEQHWRRQKKKQEAWVKSLNQQSGCTLAKTDG